MNIFATAGSRRQNIKRHYSHRQSLLEEFFEQLVREYGKKPKTIRGLLHKNKIEDWLIKNWFRREDGEVGLVYFDGKSLDQFCVKAVQKVAKESASRMARRLGLKKGRCLVDSYSQ